MRKINSVAICASTLFYPTAIEVSKKLKTLKIQPKLPWGAIQMIKSKDFNADDYKNDFEEKGVNGGFRIKAKLILNHFRKIRSSDAILVINETKHGHAGYIGGNVLMEMAVAIYDKKPIFILNPVSPKLQYYAEIMGTLPIMLDGDILNIKKYI